MTGDRLHGLKSTVGPTKEIEAIRKVIIDHRWIFAKTYAAFCPHEYTLRKEWEYDADYRMLVRFIWMYGLEAFYGRKTKPNKYWFDHENGWYYFVFPEDTDNDGNATEEACLINRAKITDFDFWKDEACGIVRCARHRECSDSIRIN